MARKKTPVKLFGDQLKTLSDSICRAFRTNGSKVLLIIFESSFLC